MYRIYIEICQRDILRWTSLIISQFFNNANLTLFILVRKTIICSRNPVKNSKSSLANLLLPRACKYNPLEFRSDFLIFLWTIEPRFCCLQWLSKCVLVFITFSSIYCRSVQKINTRRQGLVFLHVFLTIYHFYDFLHII